MTSENFNQEDIEKWTELVNHRLAENSWTPGEKMFAINICKNNRKYIDENYENIREHRIQDMLIIAAANSDEMFFVSLIEKWKIDINYENDFGRNCLMMCCMHNNLNMIKFLIDEMQMDQSVLDRKKNNCLILACGNNKNLSIEMIEYLIEKNDILHRNNHGMNCLLALCESKSKRKNHLEIIKFLIECKKIDPLATDHNNNNCLMLYCKYCTDLETIQYLIGLVDPKLMNQYDDDCLQIACQHNENLDVIKYLIESIELDPTSENTVGDNCLTSACWKNNNLGIIKYLVNTLGMDISHKDHAGNNCFLAACMNEHSGYEIVKFLITCPGINVNFLNYSGEGGLDIGQKKMIDFLVQETGISLKLQWAKVQDYEYIFQQLNDYQRINEMISTNYYLFLGETAIIPIINKINPLKLTNENRKKYDIDPFLNKTYEECVAMIDELVEPVCIPPKPEITPQNLTSCTINNNTLHDFSRPSEILFKHGDCGEVYYGCRNIVYDKILLLNEIENITLIKEQVPFELEGNLPKNAINEYITSCYTGRLNLRSIDPEYFVAFLRFIDQYPTVDVQIDKIEMQIIDYIDTNQIKYEPYLIDLCSRYKLRYMYLDAHNKKLKDK